MSLRCGPSSENLPLCQINYEPAAFFIIFFFTFLILLKPFHVSTPIYRPGPCINMHIKKKEETALFFFLGNS